MLFLFAINSTCGNTSHRRRCCLALCRKSDARLVAAILIESDAAVEGCLGRITTWRKHRPSGSWQAAGLSIPKDHVSGNSRQTVLTKRPLCIIFELQCIPAIVETHRMHEGNAGSLRLRTALDHVAAVLPTFGVSDRILSFSVFVLTRWRNR